MKIDSASVNHWMLRLDAVQPVGRLPDGLSGQVPASFTRASEAPSGVVDKAASDAALLAAAIPDRPLDTAGLSARLGAGGLELGPELIDHLVDRVLVELQAG